MISNVKKVTFLALVPVLQRKSHRHFLVYVLSKKFNFQKWHQNGQLQIFIQANITMGKKSKNLQKWPHLLSGRFIKVFYKTATCPRRPLWVVLTVIVLSRFDCICRPSTQKNSKSSEKSVQFFLKKVIKSDKNGTWKSENKWLEDPKKVAITRKKSCIV